ncbi:alpha-catulin-like [Actinia tenebrosa]|uniref:Alpha-catulin-like n=1 Tax=Actinia tenebrosa TaxID=6105 RepID=A0A6P8HVL4_ACTTE|nr:alpha-catulin-like [Actinia tenebrosa]
MAKWDSRNLEIRSKSVEQTLIPLVTQITTLVNHKDHCKKSEKGRRAIREVGEIVKNAVLKFVTVGEQIAKENEDVAAEMKEACEEAKKAGEVISRLTSETAMAPATTDKDDGIPFEKTAMVRAARSLLSAVTRVLIIADSIMIKRLLAVVKKVDERLANLETVNSFTEFVQTFSQFGAEMVELAHVSGDRQNDLKDDVLRAEMCCARSVLEKSTMMLLTTSKTCLRHPGSMAAKSNRDGVFQKMKEAIETIKLVTEDKHKKRENKDPCFAMDLKHFENSLEEFRKSSPGQTEAKIKFEQGLEKILLDVQPFINSSHTRKEKRETIIALCENAQDIMKDVIEKHSENEVPARRSSCADSLDLALQRIFKISSDLKNEVRQVAMDQVFETFSHQGHKKSLPALRNAAAIGDTTNVEQAATAFMQDAKRLEEVSQVTRNISSNEAVSITARNIEENIKTLCQQVIAAAKTLSAHPVSKIAQENMDVFIDIWEGQVEELGKLLRGITTGGDLSKTGNQNDGENSGDEKRDKEKETRHVKQEGHEKTRIDKMLNKKWDTLVSHPIPLYSTFSTTLYVTRKDEEKLVRMASNVNLLTSQLELNKLSESENEIVRQAMEMSKMICDLYLFTRGEGRLLEAEDFFNAAQDFAEAGKVLHKVARQHAIKVDDSIPKKELLRHADRLLTYCQQLIFTATSLTVGQSACYKKIWAVMNLTKHIIKLVARVVNRCYVVGEKNSPLKLPPDQRLWQIDENIFSEGSSVATSRKSSVQNLEDNLPNWMTDDLYQENKPTAEGDRPTLRTEL